MESLSGHETVLNLVFFGFGLILLMALAVILIFTTHRKRMVEKQLALQDIKIKHQKELLYHNLLVQEQERKRIAKDLHDDIGSKLAVIKLHMNQSIHIIHEAEKAKEALNETKKMIDVAIESSRSISHNLLPPVLYEFGLTHALRELSEEVSQSPDIQVDFESNVERVEPLLKEVELAIFRVTQELFSNTLKHAEATEIQLHLNVRSNSIDVEFKDNGKGFSSNGRKPSGLGINNIYSRIEMLDGTFDIQSEIGKGTTASIHINQ